MGGRGIVCFFKKKNFFFKFICDFTGSLRFPDSSVGKESTCNAGDLDSIPELGRSPGEGKGSVQFSSVIQSCLTLCDPMNFSRPEFWSG